MLDLTKILQVGDKVQTTDDGIGEVKRINRDDYYPIDVAFESGHEYSFTYDGFFLSENELPEQTLRPVGFETWEGLAAIPKYLQLKDKNK